jgi:Leucine-rich repeat (LRR) protein
MKDSDQDLDKIKQLLASGIKENIVIACSIGKNINIDVELLIQEIYGILLDGCSVKENSNSDKLAILFLKSNLSLSKKKIKSLPPVIEQFQNLKSLNLDENGFKELPLEICKLRNLESLSITNNYLKKLPPEIGELKELGFLHLQNNNLTSIPKEMEQLQKLESVNLDNNELTFIPESILKLANLVELCIKGNQLGRCIKCNAEKISNSDKKRNFKVTKLKNYVYILSKLL